jgi:hypothetical protein
MWWAEFHRSQNSKTFTANSTGVNGYQIPNKLKIERTHYDNKPASGLSSSWPEKFGPKNLAE